MTGSSLHKSCIFLALIGLAAVFLTLSLVLYIQLEAMNDDDFLVGGGDGLRQEAAKRQEKRGRKKHKKQVISSSLFGAAAAVMMEPRKGKHMAAAKEAMESFAKDKEEQKTQRKKAATLTLRERFEQEHSSNRDDREHWMARITQTLRQPAPAVPETELPYDIYNCPPDPPANYPFSWNIMTVLGNWNPDETDIPDLIYQGLCVFDWTTQADIAEQYRRHEVPFVVQNFPESMKAAERWMTPGYLEELLGEEAVRSEHSRNNHFMYWKTRRPQPDFTPPTDMVELAYKDWLQKAKTLQESDKQQIEHQPQQDQTKQEHWYFRLNAMLGQQHDYLYEELPFFDPSLGRTFTMVDPMAHRGINCRFGMKGVIAETHFDSSINFIALMGGQRRYILAHPDQCINMELYPMDHPSGRHSRIDWSKAYPQWKDSDRPFRHAQVNEVVLQAGDILYLPTFWLHFIVSLNINYQCNSRSGAFFQYQKYIDQCGFGNRAQRGK